MKSHSFSEQKPCAVERVVVDGTTLKKELTGGADAWRQYPFDLSPHAGKTVRLSLQNAANNWSGEFGYSSDVAVVIGD